MFKRAFLLFLISISLSAQKINNKTTFELRGTGVGDFSIDKIYLMYEVDNKRIYDSAKIANGKFILKGNIDYPTRAILCNNREFSMSKSNSLQLYLEPNKMEINLDFYNLAIATIKGSKTQDEYLLLEKLKDSVYIKRDSILRLMRPYMDKITASDPQIKMRLERNLEILDKLSDENKTAEMKIDFNFIRQNPSSFIAPSLLYYRLAKKEGILKYETIISLADGLSKEVKLSPGGVRLFKRISDFKNSKEGSIAPDFILKDYNGQTVSLGSFREKKYVLIDFWASWCEPCRNDLPFLKDAYEKYRSKGFEIISISGDKNLNSWRTAIADEKIGLWKQISVIENQTNIEDNYVVTAIPVKILINKQGEIIGRWKGGGDENKIELKKILEETFDKK